MLRGVAVAIFAALVGCSDVTGPSAPGRRYRLDTVNGEALPFRRAVASPSGFYGIDVYSGDLYLQTTAPLLSGCKRSRSGYRESADSLKASGRRVARMFFISFVAKND